MKKIVSLTLCLILVFSALSVSAGASWGCGPSLNDIRGHDYRLVEPSGWAWLNEYDVRYVQSTGGVSIYLRWGPSTSYDHFDTVDEGEPVTVLAEQDNFALVIASNNRLGWCKSALIVPGNERLAPMPNLRNTYWTYTRGQTLGSTYSCYFYADGTYAAYSWGSGCRITGTYYLSGRRLTLDKSIRFIWNGHAFVSSQKYEMQVGSDYYTIYPDSTCNYDSLETMTNSYYVYDMYDSRGQIMDGYYFVKLLTDYDSNGREVLSVELMQVVGVSEYSGNLIFESTNKSYELTIPWDCVIVDSSVFSDSGLTTEYYGSVWDLYCAYGRGTMLELLIEGGRVVQVDKFYIA